MRLEIDAPVNGRIHKATVNVRDDDGTLLFTDMADLRAMVEREKLANRIAGKLRKDPAELKQKLEESWTQTLNDREQQKASAQKTAADPTACNEAIILDAFPDEIRRPLCLVGGHAYAATWLSIQVTVRQGVAANGEVVLYDPPQTRSETVLVILRDDGVVFADTPVAVPGLHPLAELEVTVRMPTQPPPDRLWSGAGVKRFRGGERPDPAVVFRLVAQVADRFMDFTRSLSSQPVMCELVACYVLASYLLDAFSVIGYLWPNGTSGSGKTNFLITVCEMAYLGQVILAGGSYASLRDLADYGATLGFDDAEGIMDIKRADPDKRTLLLAGNRRGATVTVKELVEERWVTRYINAFCPRLFSAIKLPDGVLGSRAVTVPLVRSEDEDRAKANPLDHATWPCDRRRLIDDLWAVALAVLPKLRHYDAASADRAALSGRNLEPWRAVLAVALWLEEQHRIEGLFERMEKLSREYQLERSDLEADDPVRVAIKALRQMVTGPDGEKVFTPKELASLMNLIAEQEDLTDSKEGKDFTNARKVGWLLKRLRFRRAAPGKVREWKTTHAEVEALARTYGMGSSQAQETTESPASSEMTNRETF